MSELVGGRVFERQRLLNRFQRTFEVDSNLSRKLVSFQANKTEPIYRLFKYKEGFSASLVKYFLTKYGNGPGDLLDPFAGVGTTLFAGQETGWRTTGIELLPVGVFTMNVRNSLHAVDLTEFKRVSDLLLQDYQNQAPVSIIKHVSITTGAFPAENEHLLNSYLSLITQLNEPLTFRI